MTKSKLISSMINSRSKRALNRFTRDESGAFFVIVFWLFIIFVAIAGIGVDFMNYERDRANLQSTLDRAVLAAADLDQTLPPSGVVDAYLDKAGLSGKLTTDPIVTEGIGFRRVEAAATTSIDTSFMRLAGFLGQAEVGNLTASAASAAEESVGSVEIALVLDMSGSMRNASASEGRSKIAALKDAAKRFVTIMLNKQNADKVSIAIVPYATQVNAGAQILDKFSNVSKEHDYSHCVNFPKASFSQTSINLTTQLPRTAHFDIFTDSENPISLPVCPVRAGSEITAPTDDIVRLHRQIDLLSANGNTSIDLGMKWGAALLDPSFGTIIEQLSRERLPGTTDTVVPAKFANRPLSYNSDVLKVIIVMTDGQNTAQYKIRDSLRSGDSDVWFNPSYGSNGEYSVRISDNSFYWANQRLFRNHPYGEGAWEPGQPVRLSYPELWNQISLWRNANKNYRWQSNYRNNWYYNAYSFVNATNKNTQTAAICGATKNQDTIVYGIAFEAPASGLSTIKNCASSDSHVYEVNASGDLGGSGAGDKPITIDEAFVSIASSISKLRLTQ